MSFKFKIGDEVRLIKDCPITFVDPDYADKEGIVTGLGGTATPNKGAVVTNEAFESGDPSYGEHGRWFPDVWLELIETK